MQNTLTASAIFDLSLPPFLDEVLVELLEPAELNNLNDIINL